MLFYLGTVWVHLCYGFNVDVDTPTIFEGQSQSFGISVAQIENKVLVGAPFETGRVNEMGKLYQCTYPLGDCKEISIRRPRDAFNMSFGLTLVAQNDQVLFALMQFSGNFREHFNFNSKDSAQLVMKVKQLYGWTKTATGIRKVVRELFIAEKGSRNSATKILIVITDGSKMNDDAEYWEVIPEAEQAGIIRYAIGVGSAFSTIGVQQELKDIASEPDDEHVFKVNNFNALKSIQEQLQNKIFAIEGTQFRSSSSFQMEMSQEGLSALLITQGLVVGAVGAYDWSGGLLLYQTGHQDPEFINISSILKYMNNSYLAFY
ncbi:integrin alpha-M-like [Notechis scutatus]|uniref:Integrin alpha-M-like n=1 Tax=Notechis scutatus TaxID=8663 RepID=A0A6J1VFF1_9SAUR|nr:integrin alpha-M-like [Notechis scutatus]